MQLFYLRTSEELLLEFIEEHFISIEIEWLNEDVEQVQWEDLSLRYSKAIKDTDPYLFLYEMVDGDFVIVTDGKQAYVGDIGDYFYVEPKHSKYYVTAAEEDIDKQTEHRKQDNGEQVDKVALCSHRRGVTWMNAAELGAVNHWLRRLDMNPNAKLIKISEHVTPYELECTLNEASHYQKPTVYGGTPYVDEATIREAIEVLQKALRSDDAERRERAAISLLAFANGKGMNDSCDEK